MAKLHELLAAERTPTAAWNTLIADTLKKFGNAAFFSGHSKTLKMIEDSDANRVLEAQAREEKEVTTTVFDTLDYALSIFAKAEDLQYQKNATNTRALATVMWKGTKLFEGVPVDELLGLEARLAKIKELMVAMPTIDASKRWLPRLDLGAHVLEAMYPDETAKTEKVMTPVQMSPATDKHPAQVQAVTKDNPVGKFTTVHRTGAATAVQKSEAIKRIDDLMIEIKQARMRANETTAETGKIADKLVALIMEPLKD